MRVLCLAIGLLIGLAASAQAQNKPVVSLIDISVNVTEGGDIEIEAQTVPANAHDLEVRVSVTESGNMLKNGEETTGIFILRRTAFESIFIETQSDNVDEPDSVVTFSILPSEGTSFTIGYTIGSPSSKTVTVRDDDPAPVVTLALSPDTIAEAGGMSVVTASLDRPSSNATTVTVSVPADAIGAVELSTNAVLTIAAGETESTGVVTLTALDNDDDAPNRMVAIGATASNTQGITGPDPETLTITDDDENSPPTAANATVETLEDTAYVFGAADFTFSDDDAGDTLSSVTIVAPPGAGMLRLSGAVVRANASVGRADLDAGHLTFTPAANAHGTAYASFTFKVSDGKEESALAYTMTIDVTSVIDPLEPIDADVDWKAALVVGHWHVRNREWERGWRVQACVQTVDFTEIADIEDHHPNDICFGRITDRDFAVGTETYTLEGVFHSVAYNNDSLTLAFTERVDITPLLNRTFVINGKSYAVVDRYFPRGTTGRHIVWAEPAWTAADGWTVGAAVWAGLESTSAGMARAAPTVTVTRTGEGPVHGPFDVRIAFNEDVTGFEAADIAVVNGAVVADSFTVVDPRTWTARIAPAASGTVTVSIPAGAAHVEALGNAASEALTVEAELDVPTVTVTSTAQAPVSGAFTVRVTFSKAVTGFDMDDLTIEGGVATGLVTPPEGTWYDVLITPASDAREVTVTVPADAVEDGSGRGNAASETFRIAAAGSATTDDTLTASFHDVPAHDGETAFAFELRFSEEVAGLSYATLRDAAFTVTNGHVIKAKRIVPGKSRRWQIRVAPDTTADDITVSLAATTDCTAEHAICTAQGKRLAAASLTVRPVALTAAFHDMQAEHDGETPFTFELRFSIDVAGLSYVTLRDSAFTVTNGEVTRAKRIVGGKSRRWQIRVAPAGVQDVTVSLPATARCTDAGAVCARDGRALSNANTATVQGPVALSVADATVEEGEGAVLSFPVTLSRVASATVTVDYATSNGTATAGEDYTAASGTLVFAAGETGKRVAVEILDDAHDESAETLTLTLSNPSGAPIADATATGTIENSDPMPKAWTVRFGRTVGSQVVDALTDRLGGARGSHVTVAGVRLGAGRARAPERQAQDPFALPEWAEASGREAESRTVTAADLLLGSAFHLSSADANAGPGPVFSAWGRAVTGGFEAEVDDVRLDGDVTTAMLGFDAEWERALAGVMLSQSAGDGAYRLSPDTGDDGGDDGGGGDAGSVESDLTGVYPYARIEVNGRVSAWALAGAGTGSLTLDRDAHAPMKTDLSMRMGALGVTGRVLEPAGAEGLGVNVRSDAMWVRTKSARSSDMVDTEGDVTRLRLVVEGERVFAAGDGATFTPSAEVGLRHDGGDAETGTGLETGAGLRYTRGALSVEARARVLVAHEDSGYEEWGLAGAVRVEPSAGGRGLSLRIAPEWGRTGSATERLWRARDARELEGGEAFDPAGRLVAHAGYGVGLGRGRGVLTPYTGVTLGEGRSRSVRAGARWQLGRDVALGVEATRTAGDAGEGDAGLRVRAAVRF